METTKEKIQRLRNNRFTYAQIGKLLGISRQRVHQILTGYKSPISPEELRKRSEHLELVNSRLIAIKQSVFGNVPSGNITELTGLSGGARDRYRELVRIRDNHTCQICGKKWLEGQRRFDVHHLDEDSSKTRKVDNLEIEASNMVTLCHKCHLNVPGHKEKMSVNGVDKKQVLTVSVVKNLLKSGLNQVDIASKLGTTKQAVNGFIKRNLSTGR